MTPKIGLRFYTGSHPVICQIKTGSARGARRVPAWFAKRWVEEGQPSLRLVESRDQRTRFLVFRSGRWFTRVYTQEG